MTLYSLEAVEKAIALYESKGGQARVINEGVLLDDYVVTAPGCQTLVITAQYLNSNSSAYTVRRYNKTPKKYE